MKPEEFEVYVIPPNFMEGGTLFGGLLKTAIRLRRSSFASRLVCRFCTFRFPSPSAL